jgi:hypothetical protein
MRPALRHPAEGQQRTFAASGRQPKKAKEVSWRAQNRLHSRFKKLLGRRLQRNKALTAIARELSAFVWELLRELPCYSQNLDSVQRVQQKEEVMVSSWE